MLSEPPIPKATCTKSGSMPARGIGWISRTPSPCPGWRSSPAIPRRPASCGFAVPSDQATKGTKVVATRTGQTIRVEAEGVRTLLVRLSDALVDLDQPVTIEAGSTTLFSGPVFRTIGTLAKTLAERGDPALVYSAEVTVEL